MWELRNNNSYLCHLNNFKGHLSKPDIQTLDLDLAVEKAARISEMACEEEPEISISETRECKPNTVTKHCYHHFMHFYSL